MKNRETATPGNWQVIVHSWAQCRGLGEILDSHRQFEYATATRDGTNKETVFSHSHLIAHEYAASNKEAALLEEIGPPADLTEADRAELRTAISR